MMNLQKLYIVGAGGFGREVLCWLRDLDAAEHGWKIEGFLDDNPHALDGLDVDVRVVGAASDFEPSSDDCFVCGIGAVAAKRQVCGALLARGARFLTVIHPTAVLGERVRLGDGVVLCPNVTLTCDIELGAMAMINCHSSAGHDVRVGAWSTVSAHCDLTGFTELGEAVFLGSGARVIPGKRVGASAVVGAGAVVIRDVEAGAKVFGNPARVFA